MRQAVALLGSFGGGFLAWTAYNRTDRNTNIFDALQIMVTNIIAHPNSTKKLSVTGLDAIARREGFSAVRYADASGYSIGFGHFIKMGEFFDEPMSRTDALLLLGKDSEIASDAVRAYVTVPLSQNEFDALVSFVYNVGAGAFHNSTLLRKLNVGDYSGAAVEFPRWNQSQGSILDALVTRRSDEQQQFLA